MPTGRDNLRTFLAFAILVLPLGVTRTLGGEWPTYRGDYPRSGVSAEPLKLPLHEAWVHKAAHPPRPAWPELPAAMDVWHRIQGLAPTTIYDRAYHVAVAGGRLFFGSSAEDAVYCLDAATGQPRWSFRTEGPVRLAPAVDAYNGTVLWERDVPNSIRLGAFKHAGSMVAADDRLYLAAGSDCLALDAQTGRQKLAFTVPPAADGKSNEWGYVACEGDILLGSVSRPGAAFRVQDLDTETLIWRDFMPVVCSDALFARDRHTGQELWTYAPRDGVIINPTIAVGGGRAYCVESTNPRSRDHADGRAKLDVLLGQGAKLVALDVRTGKPLWQREASFAALQHIIYLSYAKETVVVMGTKNVQVEAKGRLRYDLHAFDAATGNPLWQNTQAPVPDHILQGGHGEQVQHPAISGETIYNTGFACQLRTGEPIAGWKWQKSNYCGTLTASAQCAFSRYAQPRMFDLKTGQYTVLSETTRSGCWVNILPAGGLILVPESTAGCICGYPLQTSMALTPR